jgi:ribosome-binding factor A
MKFHRISRKALQSGCCEIGTNDGLDPRLEKRGGPPQKVANRKALQLCGQVHKTLAGVFAGETGDDVLRDLVVESVVPAPTSARMLVTVYPAPSAAGRSTAEVYEHLAQGQSLLRREVAAAIHRRKVPDLIFRVIDP